MTWYRKVAAMINSLIIKTVTVKETPWCLENIQSWWDQWPIEIHDATWFQASLFLLLIFATFLCAQGALKTVRQIGCVTDTSLCVGWNTPPFAFPTVLHQRLNLCAQILVNISCNFGLCMVREHMFQQPKAEVKRCPQDSWIWFSNTKRPLQLHYHTPHFAHVTFSPPPDG